MAILAATVINWLDSYNEECIAYYQVSIEPREGMQLPIAHVHV